MHPCNQHINTLLRKIIRPGSLLLFLLFCIHVLQAQTADSLPVNGQDSLTIIKNLVKEQLSKQLQQCASYQKLEQSRLRTLLKDSSATDSLGKMVLLQVQQLEGSVKNTGKSIVSGVVQTPKQMLQQQLGKIMQTADVKGIIGQFTGLVKQPLLHFTGGSVNIQGQSAPSLFGDGNTFINSTALVAGCAIMGIPVGVQFMRQDFMGPEYLSRTTISFRFDREAYLNSLRDKLKLKIKASDLLPDYNDVLQKIKQDAIGRLTTSLDSINRSYKGVLGKQLETLGGEQNLLKGDIGALQDRLLSNSFLQELEQQKSQLAQLQEQISNGGKPDAALYDSLLQKIQSVKGINAMLEKIKSFRDEAQKSGLLDKLRQAEQFKNDNIQSLLQDPDKLKSMAKEQLDLNGVQKLFLNMNQLKIGMNTVNLSPLTVSQYVNNGINAAFVNNKTYLFIMAGKEKNFNSLFDNRFASPVFSTDNTAMGIRVGKGDITESHTHISLFTYKQGNSSYNGTTVNATPGSTVVAGFSNQMKINETNFLNLEISKSAHKYSNEQHIYDTLQQGSSLSRQLLNSENFIQQMAFTLQWNGEIKDKNLSYDLHGTRIGKGYTNPGSLFISRGMTEFGGSFRKSFLQNKLQVSAKGNFREYEYSSNSTRFRNYNFSFQGKWKFKKSQYLALSYQPYQSLRWQDNKKYNVGGSSRLSAEGSFKRRFGKINYQHVLSIAALKNEYQFDSVPVNNRSVLISSLQTITINKKSYYLNMQYNRANAPSLLAVFNTQFNADAGLMYSIRKGIVGSTAVNYNSTKDWFRQIGIKQSISGQVGERFIISMQTAIIKNIKEYRPNNMGSSRFDWSLQYLLK